jgi:hypothetical protein
MRAANFVPARALKDKRALPLSRIHSIQQGLTSFRPGHCSGLAKRIPKPGDISNLLIANQQDLGYRH